LTPNSFFLYKSYAIIFIKIDILLNIYENILNQF